jgi:hypothetical protein
MLRRLPVFALGVVLVSALGCASKSASATSQAGSPATRRSTNVITAQELSETGATNVYQAVQMLRPTWLRGRPRGSMRQGGREEVVVYLDNNRYGDISSLQQLSLGGIVEIQHFDASEATNRFGTGHAGGAIVIKMTK